MMTRVETNKMMRGLRLNAMADAWERQVEAHDARSFDERFVDLIEAQRNSTGDRRLKRQFDKARIPQCGNALEDIIYAPGRDLTRDTIAGLSDCAWIRRNQNLIITGKAGRGKTWLSCAFAVKALRLEHSARYFTVSGLLAQCYDSEADNKPFEFRRDLAKAELLVIDDWGMQELEREDVARLRCLLDDRHERGSVLVASAQPVESWEAWLGGDVVAESIVDRLVHAAHRIELKGGSMRSREASLLH